MKNMTKLATIALATATLLGTAGGASAHAYGYDERDDRRGLYGERDFARETPYRTGMIRNQLADLTYRVNRNDGRDRISEREADGLRREIRSAQQQFRWLNRDGLDHRELRVLQVRIDRIRYRLHLERNDWDGRRG